MKDEKIVFDNTVLIAVDFDGTLTLSDNFPNSTFEIDKKALEHVSSFQKKGCKIVLWTCRKKHTLELALNVLKENGFIPDYVNEGNGLRNDMDSRKINCDIYIDDRANDGIVDWETISVRIDELLNFRTKQN